MTEEQVRKSILLRGKILSLNNLLDAHKINVYMSISSVANDNGNRDAIITVEWKHQKEIIDLIKKWRDEYQKEFEEL